MRTKMSKGSILRAIASTALTLAITGGTLVVTQGAAQAAWFGKGIYGHVAVCHSKGLEYILAGADSFQCIARGGGRYELLVEYR